DLLRLHPRVPLDDPLHVVLCVRDIVVLIQIKLVKRPFSFLCIMNRLSYQLHGSPPYSNITFLSIAPSCTTTYGNVVISFISSPFSGPRRLVCILISSSVSYRPVTSTLYPVVSCAPYPSAI